MRSSVITTFSILLIMFIVSLIPYYFEAYSRVPPVVHANFTHNITDVLRKYGHYGFNQSLYAAYKKAIDIGGFSTLAKLEGFIKDEMNAGLEPLRTQGYNVEVKNVTVGNIDEKTITWNISYLVDGVEYNFTYNDTIVGFPDPWINMTTSNKMHKVFYFGEKPKVRSVTGCSVKDGSGWYFGEVGGDICMVSINASNLPSCAAYIINGSSPLIPSWYPPSNPYVWVDNVDKCKWDRCKEVDYGSGAKVVKVLMVNRRMYCMRELRDASICQYYWVWERGRSFWGRFLEKSVPDPCQSWGNCGDVALVSFIWKNGTDFTPNTDVSLGSTVIVKGLPGNKNEYMCTNGNAFFGTLEIPTSLANDLRIPSEVRGCS